MARNRTFDRMVGFTGGEKLDHGTIRTDVYECFGKGCTEEFDELEDMEYIDGKDGRDGRHFCPGCAGDIRSDRSTIDGR